MDKFEKILNKNPYYKRTLKNLKEEINEILIEENIK